MVMKSDFSLSVTMVKFCNQLIRCTCLTARNQDLHNLSSEFMEKEVVQWQESARRLLQPGLQPNQSGGLALREPARPEEAALPRQDTIYLEQDDDIQDAIPPTATSMQEHSSSVTVSPSHTYMRACRARTTCTCIHVPSCALNLSPRALTVSPRSAFVLVVSHTGRNCHEIGEGRGWDQPHTSPSDGEPSGHDLPRAKRRHSRCHSTGNRPSTHEHASPVFFRDGKPFSHTCNTRVCRAW